MDAPPEDVFAVFSRLGGEHGWLYANWLWWLRGVADRLVGGPGFRRGRRDPDEVRVGDALDFWRVEAVEPGRLMRLRAEMKVPGQAWLQFEAGPARTERHCWCRLLSWRRKDCPAFCTGTGSTRSMALIFGNMIGRLAERAEALSSPEAATDLPVPAVELGTR